MSILSTTIVQQSYARCSRVNGFFDAFYDHFMASSEEVKNHFLDTSRAMQKVFTRNGITTMLLYAMGSEKSSERLQVLADKHGPTQIDVDPSLYPLWAESLLYAVSEYDVEFTDEVEQAWLGMIQNGIKLFSETS